MATFPWPRCGSSTCCISLAIRYGGASPLQKGFDETRSYPVHAYLPPLRRNSCSHFTHLVGYILRLSTSRVFMLILLLTRQVPLRFHCVCVIHIIYLKHYNWPWPITAILLVLILPSLFPSSLHHAKTSISHSLASTPPLSWTSNGLRFLHGTIRTQLYLTV